MTTEDLTSESAPTPLSRAEDALHEIIMEQAETAAGDLDLRRLAQAALATTAPTAYAAPSRPLELRVAIEDEEGLVVEQTLALTREQADAVNIGYALGGTVASILGAYFGVTDEDGGRLTEALEAAFTALDNAR